MPTDAIDRRAPAGSDRVGYGDALRVARVLRALRRAADLDRGHERRRGRAVRARLQPDRARRSCRRSRSRSASCRTSSAAGSSRASSTGCRRGGSSPRATPISAAAAAAMAIPGPADPGAARAARLPRDAVLGRERQSRRTRAGDRDAARPTSRRARCCRISSQTAQIGGNVLGGALLVAFGTSGALLVNAATFVVSFVLVRFLVAEPRDRRRRRAGGRAARLAARRARTVFAHGRARAAAPARLARADVLGRARGARRAVRRGASRLAGARRRGGSRRSRSARSPATSSACASCARRSSSASSSRPRPRASCRTSFFVVDPPVARRDRAARRQRARSGCTRSASTAASATPRRDHLFARTMALNTAGADDAAGPRLRVRRRAVRAADRARPARSRSPASAAWSRSRCCARCRGRSRRSPSLTARSPDSRTPGTPGAPGWCRCSPSGTVGATITRPLEDLAMRLLKPFARADTYRSLLFLLAAVPVAAIVLALLIAGWTTTLVARDHAARRGSYSSAAAPRSASSPAPTPGSRAGCSASRPSRRSPPAAARFWGRGKAVLVDATFSAGPTRLWKRPQVQERPGRDLTSRREGSRHRSRDGCLRVRNRPRKRRAPQGGLPRVVANARRGSGWSCGCARSSTGWGS